MRKFSSAAVAFEVATLAWVSRARSCTGEVVPEPTNVCARFSASAASASLACVSAIDASICAIDAWAIAIIEVFCVS